MSALLEVADLRVWFPVRSGWRRAKGVIKAVDGVDLTVHRGQTLGVVGESGSGKTTIARAILRVDENARGSVRLDGEEILNRNPARMADVRRRLQMVFQDPYASLDPRQTVAQILAEPLRVHDLVPKTQRAGRIRELLELVGLPTSAAGRYPHEFSGGQRQRIGIARALAVDPELIVCDEPVSALDVSVQAQVMNLLADVQRRTGVAYIFVAHDLAVVRHIADQLAVMYLGRIVETGPADSVYGRPSHPYTQALLSAVPVPDSAIEKNRRRIVLPGDIPSPADPPSGCRFHTRCPLRERLGKPAVCADQEPALAEVGAGHRISCHFPTESKSAANQGETCSSDT